MPSCKNVVISDVHNLIAHIKTHLDEKAKIICPFISCNRFYQVKSSFSSHVSRCHWDSMNTIKRVTLKNNYVNDHQESNVSNYNSANDVNEIFEDGNILNDSTLNQNFVRNLALFYLKLETKHLLPSSTIQKISEEILELSNCNNEIICEKIKQKLLTYSTSPDEAEQIVSEIRNNNLISIYNLEFFKTDYKRKCFYKRNFYNYVEPVNIYLGINKLKKPSYCQYIPIAKTLQNIFNHKDINKMSSDYVNKKVSDGVFRDVWDGKVFKENLLFMHEPESLPLILYQDAFEVVNPIGSAKKKHKVIGVYFTLANLPPFYRDNINNIQLLLLCKETDFRYFGQSKIFSALINDLKELELNGTVINNETVKGAVCCVVGDNLGSHCIGGFLEGFNSEYMCRYCLITNCEFHKKPFTIGSIRTKESYDDSVKSISGNQSCNGIKFSSHFNALKYFHVCQPGLPPCLGHDLFEGVVAYDLFLYLQHFVKDKKLFTYEKVNFLLLNFNFKGTDSRNKPNEIDSKKHKITGHAAQNWCLLRLFPILFGRCIKDFDDPVWELCMLLRSIVEFICAPKINISQIVYLQSSIEEYLYLRAKIFPSVPLRPKHHYLIHYPTLIAQFGPLIRTWTLRFESKHSYFKRCARQSGNFKNICATLALRHQLLQTYIHADTSVNTEIYIHKPNEFHLELYTDTIQKVIPKDLFLPSNTVISYSVKVQGTSYNKDYCVPVSEDKDSFSFCKILCILVKNNTEVYFVVEALMTTLIGHLGIYEIGSSKHILLVKINDILDYYPLPLYEISESNFLCLHHAII